MKPITVKNISMHYGDVRALDDVSLEVNPGELFGMIGPDGAGKTSLIRILTTLLIPQSGKAEVLGLDTVSDYKKIRDRVGYMPGRFSLYQDLTVEENLSFFATIFGTTIEENYDLVADIYSHIEPFKKRRAGKLSGGMKQKLALSCALIHKPDVLFLDEPSTGVDPVSRKELWTMLKKLSRQGITVFVSTPYMDEAEMCDRIALIQEGKLLDVDSPEQIKKKFPHRLFSMKCQNVSKLLNILRNDSHAHSVFAFGEAIHYIDKDKNVTAEEIKSRFAAAEYKNLVCEETAPTIEDCFMELMQGGAHGKD